MTRAETARRIRLGRHRDWLLLRCPLSEWTQAGLLWLFRLASKDYRREDSGMVLARYLFRCAVRGDV